MQTEGLRDIKSFGYGAPAYASTELKQGAESLQQLG
jgi:hypothetical protein